jgi:integrase
MSEFEDTPVGAGGLESVLKLLSGLPVPHGESQGHLREETNPRAVDAQATPERRAFFAILYGTGIEVSMALRLTRADVWDASREIRAAGTKTHTRDRVCMVAEWAWPTISGHVKRMLPTARLFPVEWKPYQVNHWHRWIVGERMKLPRRLNVHAARHHWAIMRLRAGVPIAVVQAQLGHSTPMLTLTTYGPFVPTGADRAYWERQVTKAETRRVLK